MPPKHTSLFSICFTYYVLRNRADEGTLTLTMRSVMKSRPTGLFQGVCKSSTSRANSVYFRINWSISSTLWPWSDSLCFLQLAAKAYNNASIVGFFSGSKSMRQPHSRCVWPVLLLLCFKLHLPSLSLDSTDMQKKSPLPASTTGQWESHESCLLTKCGGAQEPGCPWPLLRWRRFRLRKHKRTRASLVLRRPFLPKGCSVSLVKGRESYEVSVLALWMSRSAGMSV